MPPPTTFGALGHLFETRDSAELLQDSYGKKHLKPMYDRDSMKFTVLSTLGVEDKLKTQIFDKYRRRMLDPFEKSKYDGTRGVREGHYVSKYGTSLGQGDMRLLPKTWVELQRNKGGMRPPSVCSEVSDISSLCVTKRGTENREDDSRQRPRSILDWISEEEILEEQERHKQKMADRESRLEMRRQEEATGIESIPRASPSVRLSLRESIAETRSRSRLGKDVRKCIKNVFDRLTSLEMTGDGGK